MLRKKAPKLPEPKAGKLQTPQSSPGFAPSLTLGLTEQEQNVYNQVKKIMKSRVDDMEIVAKVRQMSSVQDIINSLQSLSLKPKDTLTFQKLNGIQKEKAVPEYKSEMLSVLQSAIPKPVECHSLSELYKLQQYICNFTHDCYI